MIILTRKQLLAVAALAVALVAVVLGLAYRNDLRAWAAPQKPATGEPAGHDMATMEEPKERKVLYWYDPMHPAYKSVKPGVARLRDAACPQVRRRRRVDANNAGRRRADFARQAAAHRRAHRHGGG